MNRAPPQLDRRQFVRSLPTAAAAVAVTVAAPLRAEGARATVPARKPGHKQVLLIAGEKFEELEFAAITGVMSWVRTQPKDKVPPVDVVVAGFDKEVSGFGSMHIRPELLVPELNDEDLAEFDAVAIPAALSKEGGKQLTSERTHDIVRKIHARGGVVCAMCDGIAAVPKDLRGKTCRYWERRKEGVPNDEEHAPIVVDRRIITTAGQAVAVPTAVVLLELLRGKEVAERFVAGCPCTFGFDAEFASSVRVYRAET